VVIHKDGRVVNAHHITSQGFEESILYECSPETCSCMGSCRQRLTPLDGRLTHKLEIYKDKIRGFCCRTQRGYSISRGSYVCDFVGEFLPAGEYKARDLNKIGEYSMNVSVPGEEDAMIDPYYYGNCSRFFAHSCNSNLAYIKLYSEHRNLRLPTIAFVTATEIPESTDLSIDYGKSWWEGRDFGCACGFELCRHRRRKDGRRLPPSTKRIAEFQGPVETSSTSSGSDLPISMRARSPFIRQPPTPQVPSVLLQNDPRDEEDDETVSETISWDKVPFCKSYIEKEEDEERIEQPIEVDDDSSFPGTVCVATLGCNDMQEILDSTGCFSRLPIKDSIVRTVHSTKYKRAEGILRSVRLLNTRGSVLVILPKLFDCLAAVKAECSGWSGEEQKPGSDFIAGKIAVHHPDLNLHNPGVERLWSNEFVEIILTTKEFYPTAEVSVSSIVVLMSEGDAGTISSEQMGSLVEDHMSQSGDGLLLFLLDVGD